MSNQTRTSHARAARRERGNLLIAKGNVMLVIFAICLAFAAMSIFMSAFGMLMSSANFIWVPKNLVDYVTQRTALSTYIAIGSVIATAISYRVTKDAYAKGDELLQR